MPLGLAPGFGHALLAEAKRVENEWKILGGNAQQMLLSLRCRMPAQQAQALALALYRAGRSHRHLQQSQHGLFPEVTGVPGRWPGQKAMHAGQ